METACVCSALARAPHGVRIGPVKRGDRDWWRWLGLHHARYRATHRDNRPRWLVARERASIFAGSDLLLALGLWRDGRLVGFASLRRGGPGLAEVGWVGVEGPEPTRACGWLLRRCAQEARRNGHRWLEIEIDCPDDQLAPLIGALPSGRQQVFFTWTCELSGRA